MTSPPAIPITLLCIANGERLLKDFVLSVAVKTRCRGHGPVEVPVSYTCDLSIFVMVSIKSVFINPTVSPQATITNSPYKGSRPLGMATNDPLVIALAIEYKGCHLPTNKIECNNSPSLHTQIMQ